MYRKIVFMFVLVLAICGCQSKRSKLYNERISLLIEYKNKYLFGTPPGANKETASGLVILKPILKSDLEAFRNVYLDSALIVIHEIENMDIKPAWRNTTYMRKAEIYYFKQDYEQAVEALKHVDGGLPFAKYRDILINKIKAKEAQANGDTLTRDSLYRVILNDYEKYYQDVEVVLKRTLRGKDEDKVFYSWANTILVEMFHYKLKLEKQEIVIHQIDSLQKAINGNKEYFDHLKKLLIKDKNYEVLFE